MYYLTGYQLQEVEQGGTKSGGKEGEGGRAVRNGPACLSKG